MDAHFINLMDTWIPQVIKAYSTQLGADVRFPDGKALLASFVRVTDLWFKRQSEDDIKALDEKANELAAAVSLLDGLEAGQTLLYEPKLASSKKSIDFLIKSADAPQYWVDVKTVAPLWSDTEKEWERFVAIRAKLPANVNVHLENELGGAGIASQMLKSRWRLYTRAAEIEAKREELTDDEKKAPLTVLFCSGGFVWHVDTLEDFADFYRTGRFRQDNWAATMITHYMEQQKINFKHTLAGFHYLERHQFDVLPNEFVKNVRGSRMFA